MCIGWCDQDNVAGEITDKTALQLVTVRQVAQGKREQVLGGLCYFQLPITLCKMAVKNNKCLNC